MAAARHLVVVGGADASATDTMADALRDEFAVRTAYSERDLFASLDGEVDVVLVDPRLSGFDADRLRERIRERALDCQVGVLAGDSAETATDAGARATLADAFVTVPPDPAAEETWRTTVSRLAARAHYRKRLEEYYDIADEYAALAVESESAAAADDADDETPARADDRPGSADLAAERERLAEHLERLRTTLAEMYDDLDADSLFDVALDPWDGDDPSWRDDDATGTPPDADLDESTDDDATGSWSDDDS